MYDNFSGPGFDWNGNGKTDSFDYYMDMKIVDTSKSSAGSRTKSSGSSGGIVIYDSTKDSDGVALLKALAVCGLCLVGMIVPVTSGMGDLGTLVWLGGCIGLSIRILKNR